MAFTVPFDTAPFVKLSIMKVVQTFVEAMVLVFLVMLLFLHKIRCTLIPAIVAPVALLGTFTVMLLSGYSINILTMFGMVLAIGIIVDDAIVVVENVERLMEEKPFSARRYPGGHGRNHPGNYRDHAGTYRCLYTHGFC